MSTWLADDIQDRCGVSHLAYLAMPGYRSSLPPFALWPAFPAASVGRHSHDYYGGSVAVGLAPRRRSPVPDALDVASVT